MLDEIMGPSPPPPRVSGETPPRGEPSPPRGPIPVRVILFSYREVLMFFYGPLILYIISKKFGWI